MAIYSREDILYYVDDFLQDAYYLHYPDDIIWAAEKVYDAVYQGRKEWISDLYYKDWELMDDLMRDYFKKDLAEAIVLWQGRM